MTLDYRFKSRLSYIIISLLFLIILCPTYAQTSKAQIYGVVVDTTTGKPLFGANVWLKGTSLGASSDINGQYEIVQVPEGSYDLVVRYIGYREKVFHVTVKGGARVELNASLLSQAIETKSVTVTAQASGQKEAINQQLTSNTIINVVSADKIHQLPDASAAAALSRLPGVSLMNGDQVVIRGVQAKENQILLNGVELPSTDMNTRATDLGFISSNLLSGIEVIKALTPDMDANALGGEVNLRIREAPTGFHFDLLTQGSYNSTDRVGDNYTFWASASDRFLDNKLGVFLQGNMDRSDGGNQVASISTTLLGTNNNAYGQGTYITNGATFEYDADIVKNSSGSLILDYRLPNGKIVFQNTYAGNVTDQLNNYILFNFDNTSATYTPNRSLYGKDLWINALQAENNFGDIKVNLSLSHSATEQYTIFGYSPGLYGAAWSEFYNQTGTTAPFGYDASGNPIRYNSAAAEEKMSLTNALGVLNDLNPADPASSTIGGWTQSIANQFYQHLYNASLDVTAPVTFSRDITAIFKAGGKYIRTTRENNIDELFAHGATDLYTNQAADNYFGGSPLSVSNPLKFSQVMNNDFTRGQYYMSDLYNFTNGGFKYTLDRNSYDNWLKLSEQGWAVPVQFADSYKNDWNGAEQFSAAYLMGTFNIGPQLTLLGGARFESYNMIYHAQFTEVLHTVFGDAVSTEDGTIVVNDSTNPSNPYHTVPYSAFNVNRTDNNIFPNVQLHYKVNDWSDIRLAYTTGISRPDYTAIIPKVAFYVGNFEMGNPFLKPATAQNFDIVGSFHNNSIGLFTVDAFYKVIKNQMYNTSIYYVNRSQYTADSYIPDSLFLSQHFGFTVSNSQQVALDLNNPNLGYIRGVEIDWQTNFWYLPGPLSGLVLDVNYTKSGSNTIYHTLTPTISTVYDTVNGRVRPINVYTTVDSGWVGRLVQQANDVVNVALGIDYKGFSGRISFSLTGNLLNSVGSRPELNSFTGNIYRWDFSLKQDLPIDGLSVALNGVNIFHNGINTYQDYRTSPGAPVTKNLVSVLYSPTVFELNLRYTF
jgi:TonB-dependent receptor